jgi:Sec-independent protein translocase protein TatA
MLVLPPPFPWPTAFSLGDLLIAAGIIVLLQGPIKLPKLSMMEAPHLRGRGKGGLAVGKTTTEKQERISYESQKP